jgi:hypothetical protein
MDSPDLSHAAWRKSSRSANGGNCVEVAVAACVSGHMIAVRDSKDRSGPVLVFAPDEWRAFAAGVRAGEFNHL